MDVLAEPGIDFGREIIPAALSRYRVNAFLHRGYWADVGTVEAYYDANIALTRPEPPFQFYDSHRPIYTHPRFLPGSRLDGCSTREAIISDGCSIEQSVVEQSIVGIRGVVRAGSRISRSLVIGADFYEPDDQPARQDRPKLGIGRNTVLDRVVVDKNARIGDDVRLVNEKAVQEADGDGYCIRSGIIIVQKNAVIPNGTVV
jgi:glucose-1-phosphate adenylyltransferase